MNIEIELCGYKGRINRIWGSLQVRAEMLAFGEPPESKSILYVNVSFEEPYPEGILSTAFIIPAKEYTKEELLSTIKKEGEKQLAKAIARHAKESEDNALRRQRQEELNILAKRMEDVLGSEEGSSEQ